jgi:hypothetical protein
MKLRPDSSSYMQLCLHMDVGPLYLMVPTYFDSKKEQWMGAVHLLKAKKMILGMGKSSKELEENFNEKLREHLEDSELSKETFDLFKPLSYWGEMQEQNEDIE